MFNGMEAEPRSHTPLMSMALPRLSSLFLSLICDSRSAYTYCSRERACRTRRTRLVHRLGGKHTCEHREAEVEEEKRGCSLLIATESGRATL